MVCIMNVKNNMKGHGRTDFTCLPLQANKPPSHIQKRSILAITAWTTIFLVTNLVTSVWKIFNERHTNLELEKKEAEREILARKLQTQFNLTFEAEKQTIASIDVLKNIVRKEHQRISRTVYSLPHFTWIAAFMQSRITTKALDLEKIMETYIKHKIATTEMAEAFNLTFLKEVDPEDTFFESTQIGTRPGHIKMNFVVRNLSSDTSVYKVYGFKHWDNLDEIPTYKEYAGHRYLIYNKTSDCAKAIDEPSQRLVFERCTKQGGRDSRLMKWRTIVQTNDVVSQNFSTSVSKTGIHNYVQCYPKNITVQGIQRRCPPYVFKLFINQTFSTDDYEYTAEDIKISVDDPGFNFLDTFVHRYHADDVTFDDEIILLDKLKAAKEKLKEAEILQDSSYVIDKTTVNYSTPAVLILVVVVVAAQCILILHFKLQKDNDSLHSRTARAFLETIAPERAPAEEQVYLNYYPTVPPPSEDESEAPQYDMPQHTDIPRPFGHETLLLRKYIQYHRESKRKGGKKSKTRPKALALTRGTVPPSGN